MDTLSSTLLTGIGATAMTDLWSWARRRLLQVPPPDFGLVGRWIGHMPRGRFRHASIAAATPVAGEGAIGWSAHYLIGVGFAALLPLLWGAQWFRDPRPGPALLVGIATVAAPWLVMQPGMGAGLAARRTPNPPRARLHSFLTHAIFGLGLYTCGWVLSRLPT